MKKRDYDKEPLIIKNYSVYFALSYYLLLCFICFIVIGYCIITKHNVVRLEIEICKILPVKRIYFTRTFKTS